MALMALGGAVLVAGLVTWYRSGGGGGKDDPVCGLCPRSLHVVTRSTASKRWRVRRYDGANLMPPGFGLMSAREYIAALGPASTALGADEQVLVIRAECRDASSNAQRTMIWDHTTALRQPLWPGAPGAALAVPASDSGQPTLAAPRLAPMFARLRVHLPHDKRVQLYDVTTTVKAMYGSPRDEWWYASGHVVRPVHLIYAVLMDVYALANPIAMLALSDAEFALSVRLASGVECTISSLDVELIESDEHVREYFARC